jgi:intracellular multiplication protein IcmE
MSEAGTPDDNGADPEDNPSKKGNENNASKGASRISRTRRGGLLSFRNIAILTVLIVGGAVGYEIWKNPELVGPSWLSRPPNVDDTPAGYQLRTSERYQDNLRQQNEDGAREAQEGDTSFIATPDEPLRQIDEKPPIHRPNRNRNRPLTPANTPVEPEPPRTVVIDRQQSKQQPRPTAGQPDAPNYARINQLAQLMATQQQGLLGSWHAQPSTVTVVVEEDLIPSDDVREATGSAGQGQVSGASPALAAPLIRAGDVVLASTLITNDSDTPGPVVAQIRSGPLKGARLLGGFENNLNNTHLLVQFNAMVLPDGTEVPVSAYALDAGQKSLAVRTDLDRQLFAPYAPRVAAAFVSGVGEALSDPGTSLIDRGGVTGVTRPAATIEQAFYRWQAEVGNDLAGEFVRGAPRGPLISLRSRQIIGGLFTSNVERQR